MISVQSSYSAYPVSFSIVFFSFYRFSVHGSKRCQYAKCGRLFFFFFKKRNIQICLDIKAWGSNWNKFVIFDFVLQRFIFIFFLFFLLLFYCFFFIFQVSFCFLCDVIFVFSFFVLFFVVVVFFFLFIVRCSCFHVKNLFAPLVFQEQVNLKLWPFQCNVAKLKKNY